MSIYDKSSLVLIPSGTKTSKVYSQKPTNGDGDFDFTRSTAATRVNADGNIEKETSNLLLQSNSFDTTWNIQRTAVTSGQTDPNGGSTAWKITESTNATATYSYLSQAVTANTISFYAKAGEISQVLVYLGTSRGVYFDLTDGSFVGYYSANTDMIYNSTSVGGGWYRYSVFYIGLSVAEIYTAVSGDIYHDLVIGNGFYLWRAQAEQGLVARDYIETTTTALYGGITDNVPRLDYTDSSCPALLLEPQRSNLVPHSEYLAVGWTYDNTSVISNSIVSPTGEISASKLLDNTTNGLHRMYYITGTSASAHTFSIFLKKGEYSKVEIESLSGVTTNITYDLLNGTATSVGEIEPYGNDWYRCIFPMSTTSSSNAIQIRLVNNSNSSVFVGTGTSGVHMFGAMLEAGSYATSYIPTYGTSVTRNADACLGAGDANTFNSTEGVLYWEGSFDSTSTIAGAIALIGGGSNRVQLYNSGTSLVALIQVNGSVIWSQSTSGTIDITSNHKYAVKWALNDFALWIDGVEFAVNSSGATFSDSDLTELRFSDFGASYLYAKTNQVLTFNTALSDTELADLTTI